MRQIQRARVCRLKHGNLPRCLCMHAVDRCSGRALRQQKATLGSLRQVLVYLGMIPRTPIGNLVNVGGYEGRSVIMCHSQRDDEHPMPRYEIFPRQKSLGDDMYIRVPRRLMMSSKISIKLNIQPIQTSNSTSSFSTCSLQRPSLSSLPSWHQSWHCPRIPTPLPSSLRFIIPLPLNENTVLTVPQQERQCAPNGAMCTREIPCCTSLCIVPNTICI